jgi:hypothetical protein
MVVTMALGESMILKKTKELFIRSFWFNFFVAVVIFGTVDVILSNYVFEEYKLSLIEIIITSFIFTLSIKFIIVPLMKNISKKRMLNRKF